MKKILFLLLFGIVSTQIYSQNNTAYWQQQVNYNIDVTLHDNDHTLDGYVKMEYFNHSPDTLHFIWIHLWNNAYKNDRTAFSDQLLENGRTDFYFSNNEERGYINRLEFKVNGNVVKMIDHPLYQDVIQLELSSPIAPGSKTLIETPFHVKLPDNFSRGGHSGQSYQITQWYPKPAVYDRKGWHPIPYLDQGEFYSEFGNYKVQITLPKNYIVAATGVLTNMTEETPNIVPTINTPVKKVTNPNKHLFPSVKKVESFPPSVRTLKTLVYLQENVHDFAWFADKRFQTLQDTIHMNNGKTVTATACFLPGKNDVWKHSIEMIKKTILTRSAWLGDYPYSTVTVVEAKMGFPGGMEYPTITSISPVSTEKELEETIEHEVGHNWLYGILATNERDHPWMDEGMNTYYDNRYQEEHQNIIAETNPVKGNVIKNKIPDNLADLGVSTVTGIKTDQPIETPSAAFSEMNYELIAYAKTGRWMKQLELKLGKPMFDSCMHAYYHQWQFKHPYPEDFKQVVDRVSGENTDDLFSALSKKGAIPGQSATKKSIKLTLGFNLKNTDHYKYLSVLPAIGYNQYDQLMIGALIHNISLPLPRLQFELAPLYGTQSKQLNGIGKISYSWYPANQHFSKIELGVNGDRFSSKASLDTNSNKVFESFTKISPSLRLYFTTPVRKKIIRYLELRSYFFREESFNNYNYISGSDSTISYPVSKTSTSRYLNQLSFHNNNFRALYPYDYALELQQGDGFYRLNLTGHYFFNYAKGGGMQVRLFAAKFGYIGAKNYATYIYQPKLLAANGTDDYTYNDYFIGRTASLSYDDNAMPLANKGIAAQQISTENTGGLKFRLDPYSYLQGQSENWVAALNFRSSLPNKLFPIKLPLYLFFDIGTYSEAWGKQPPTTKFLYTGGLQISLFKNLLNIYAPLIYSKDFKNTLATDPAQNSFMKKLTFSINFGSMELKKSLAQILIQ